MSVRKPIILKQLYLAMRIFQSLHACKGTVIMPGAYVRSNAMIGDHCIVNTGSVIEHECRIGNYSNISPNVTLCGKVAIEDRVDIGAGVTVLPGKGLRPILSLEPVALWCRTFVNRERTLVRPQ